VTVASWRHAASRFGVVLTLSVLFLGAPAWAQAPSARNAPPGGGPPVPRVVLPEVLPDRRHGFAVTFQESTGAHTWVNWRNYLHEFAPRLFR